MFVDHDLGIIEAHHQAVAAITHRNQPDVLHCDLSDDWRIGENRRQRVDEKTQRNGEQQPESQTEASDDPARFTDIRAASAVTKVA